MLEAAARQGNTVSQGRRDTLGQEQSMYSGPVWGGVHYRTATTACLNLHDRREGFQGTEYSSVSEWRYLRKTNDDAQMFLLFSDSKAFVSVSWDKWWETVGKGGFERWGEYMIATGRMLGSPLGLGAYARQEPCLATKKIKAWTTQSFAQ